jgi:uncharacterized repeat protein (TIGR02543 family)
MRNSIIKTGENPVCFPVTRLRKAVFIITACLIASLAVVQAQVHNPRAVTAAGDNSVLSAAQAADSYVLSIYPATGGEKQSVSIDEIRSIIFKSNDSLKLNTLAGAGETVHALAAVGRMAFEMEYTVTFDAQGGSARAPLAGVEHGSRIAEPDKELRLGFVGEGFYTGADYANKWDFAVSEVVSDTTLYAKWNIRKYTVTFDAKGGSARAPLAGVEHGSTIAEPDTPVKEGFVFDGWYTGTDYANKWDFTVSAVVSDTTLYAKWSVRKYTVTFNAQGGSARAPLTGIEHGSTITEPDTPVKEGFVFDGWYTGTDYANKWDFAISAVVSNTTLYAKWNFETGLSDLAADSKLRLYPNPAGAQFTIGGLNGAKTLSLSDLTGKLIISRPVNEGETVSVVSLPKGIYIVKIGNKAVKLIKN